MAAVIWIVLVLSLAAAALCIRLAYIGQTFGKLTSKLAASFGFVLVGMLCATASPLGEGRVFYAVLLLPGLFFGMTGDAALAYTDVLFEKRNRCVRVSMAAYTVCHLLYCIGFASLRQQGALFLLIAAALCLALLCLQQFFRVKVPNKLRILFYSYIGVSCLMTGLACGAAVATGGLLGWLLCIAAWLLTASGCILALRHFSALNRRWFTAACLGSYYLSQLLLALSIWLR